MINKMTDRITFDNAHAFTFSEMTEKAIKAENKVAQLEYEMKHNEERERKFAKDAFAHARELKDEIARLKAELASLKA